VPRDREVRRGTKYGSGVASGSRICPHCGGLNAVDADRCFRCDRRLPPARLTGAFEAFRKLKSVELLFTMIFGGLCLVVFILCVMDQGGLGPLLRGFFTGSFDLSVTVRFGGLWGPLGRLEPFRHVSAIFIHFGILHLGLNMLALTSLSRYLEPSLGSARYAVLFVVSGTLGFVASELYYGAAGPPTGGASGSLFGMMGAFLAELQVRRDPRLKEVLIQFAIYAVVFALVFPVNNAAHLGGLVAGFGLGQLYARERRAMRFGRVMPVLAGVCVISVFGSLVAANASDAWKQIRVQEIQSGAR